MSKDIKNSNTKSIEELIDLSLDIAEEEVMKEEITTVVDSELEAIDEEDELIESGEFNLDTIKEDDEAIDPQIESDVEPEETLESEFPDKFDLDESLDKSELEPEPDMIMEVEPEVIDQEIAQTETGLIQAEGVKATEQIQELVQFESIETLESEVSELETEIQIQMDKLALKADHLKTNIQSELQRVSKANEKLQQQVTKLEQQLSESEEKVDVLVEMQDRQQVAIKKLIRILKGVNTKIAHLYDEK